MKLYLHVKWQNSKGPYLSQIYLFLGSYLHCPSYVATGNAGQANEDYPQLTLALNEKVAVPPGNIPLHFPSLRTSLKRTTHSSAGHSATIATKTSEDPTQAVGSEANKALIQSSGNPSAPIPGTGEGRVEVHHL